MSATAGFVERFTASIDRLVGAILGRQSPPPTLWPIVAGIVASVFVGGRFRSWYRLRHIKGPFWATMTDFWLIRRTYKGEIYSHLGQVCKDYGPIARIGPNYVLCGDPSEIRRLWAVRSGFDRGIWYKGFQLDPPNDCTVSMRDNDIHTVLRAKLATGYAGKGIVGLHESIDEGVARFVRLIEEKYLSTDSEYRPVDFAPKVQFMAIDIISKIAFGESFGFMEEDGDKFGYIKQTETAMPIMLILGMIPSLITLLHSPLMKPFRPSEKAPNGLGPLIRIAKRVVGERFGPSKIDRPDMLGSFVRNGLSQREAESESLVQIIAGSDTTATALRTTLFHIITSPRVCARLQAELDEADAAGAISSPCISDAESRSLPYLQACVREGVRIWPPVSGILPRISDQDAVVCGVKIPAGTSVCWSAKACLHDEAVFGADADIFRPERWLTDDKDKLLAMENCLDLCFGHGRWGCLGRPIATVELNKMIPELVRRFDFAVVDPVSPIKNRFYGPLQQSKFWVRISRRENIQ